MTFLYLSNVKNTMNLAVNNMIKINSVNFERIYTIQFHLLLH